VGDIEDGNSFIPSSIAFQIYLRLLCIDDRISMQKYQPYFLSEDNSRILHRISDGEEVACWIPAQYRDIVGHYLSVDDSTVSFSLVSGRHFVVDMDPSGTGQKQRSIGGGFGRGQGGVSLLGDTWDDILSKSMADRKLTLYGSYNTRR
jgi:hypothetical protein